MSQITPQPAGTLSAVEGCQFIVQRVEQRLARVPHDVWFVTLAVLLAWASFQFGERIAIRDGLGFEGENYGNWVRDFHYEAAEVGIDAYCIQRVFHVGRAKSLRFCPCWNLVDMGHISIRESALSNARRVDD